MQTGVTLALGGKRRQNNKACAEGLTLILNYNLLATDEADIDECLKTMYEAYSGNLSPVIAAVLVSATGNQELKSYEIQIRNKYRRKLYYSLYTEGAMFSSGNTGFIHPLRLQHVWSKYSGIDRNTFLRDYLDDICEFYSNSFMVIHRMSRVLRKCGQYQDLMLLSAGHDKAFSYCDPDLYGSSARPLGQDLFDESPDVRNILNKNFRYTLVLDADTVVEKGVIFDLLKVAAAHPDKAILQPAIKFASYNTDTLFMKLETMRQSIFEPITNAMTELLGQSGYYGKGLLNNNIYIENIIGTSDNAVERVPIDVLSHDTFEAALLKPLYVGSVFLIESPSYNYVTWYLRELRWNMGEILYMGSTFKIVLLEKRIWTTNAMVAEQDSQG